MRFNFHVPNNTIVECTVKDSATSKKLEMNLTNVARASLDEVRKDYLRHLSRRNLPVWRDGEPLFTEARNLRPRTLEEAAAWVNESRPDSRKEERAAILGAILAAQAHWYPWPFSTTRSFIAVLCGKQHGPRTGGR